MVESGQVRLVGSKVEAFSSFPVPSPRHELLRFMGTTGYYSSFCRNFSAVTAPLIDPLHLKVQIFRSFDSQHASECIKVILSNVPILAAPSYALPFKLVVDLPVMQKADVDGCSRITEKVLTEFWKNYCSLTFFTQIRNHKHTAGEDFGVRETT